MNEEDLIREDRISMEAVVDAYDPQERAMGWYYYLISFPFTAECIIIDKRTPLVLGEHIVVTGMAGEDFCANDMLVDISWQNKLLAIPLSLIKPIDADDDSIEAVEDWQYWLMRGYVF